jgi:hypothetical protein
MFKVNRPNQLVRALDEGPETLVRLEFHGALGADNYLVIFDITAVRLDLE